MDATELGQWSLELRNRINEIAQVHLPTHVSTRLALLAQGQPVEFVDVSTRLALLAQGQPVEFVDVAAAQEDDYTITGEITVFTAELVGLIRLVRVQGRPREQQSPAGDVDVKAVPRSALVSMAIEKADGNVNYNGAWMSSQPRWPSFGELRLTYVGLSDDIVLGRPNLRYREDAPELDAFLPRLVADLGKN